MPFLYDFTIEINDHCGVIPHRQECFLKDESKLDELTRELEIQPNYKAKVITFEPAVRQLIDLCPRCHMRGVPKIEKKDTRDNRERSGRYDTSITRRKRLPEYWLTYMHSKSKKCRICQYTITPGLAYKKNKINIEKYFFPQVIESLKNGSFWYADQSQ